LTSLGATSPELRDDNYIDPRIDGFSHTWAFGSATSSSGYWYFRCYRHLPIVDSIDDKRYLYGDHARIWTYDGSSSTQKWSNDNFIFLEMLGANLPISQLAFAYIGTLLLLQV
jgi:hypothetical protein